MTALHRLLIAAACVLAILPARAQLQADPATASTENAVPMTVVEETILIPSAEFSSSLGKARAAMDNTRGKSPSFSKGAGYARHITWGADAGSSIDMSATGMSTIDLDINVGYKGSYVRFLGIGAGISTMVENSSRFYPVYALFRSSFSPRPRFCFLELRAGAALCNLRDLPTEANPYASVGLGITLAHSKRFSSHIVLAYTGIALRGEAREQLDNLHFATLRLGVAF